MIKPNTIKSDMTKILIAASQYSVSANTLTEKRFNSVTATETISANNQRGTLGSQNCRNDAAATASAAIANTQKIQYVQPTKYPAKGPKIGSIRSRNVLAFLLRTAISANPCMTNSMIIPPR